MKGKDNKFILPCTTCLTQAICKSKASDICKWYNPIYSIHINAYFEISSNLQTKCSILRKYIQPKLYKPHPTDTLKVLSNKLDMNKRRLKTLLQPLVNNHKEYI